MLYFIMHAICFNRFALHRQLVRRCSTIQIVTQDKIKVPEILIDDKIYSHDEWTNVTPSVLKLMDRKLHQQASHPLCLLKRRIVDFFDSENCHGGSRFKSFDDLHPVVSIEQNFDQLLVPKDHPSRNRSDSYYLNGRYMLRAHTSCHQFDLLSQGLERFLVIGDVYRRDKIDSSHYPTFHQVEGVQLMSDYVLDGRNFERTRSRQAFHSDEYVDRTETRLKACLLSLTRELFGNDFEYRWVDCYFPFTHPSWELEIYYNGNWMEVLGCGVIEHNLLTNCGIHNRIGWAFGLGLERLAMKLYEIKDIRTFWSSDAGFLSQFAHNDPYLPVSYKEISRFPPCVNDVSFWLPAGYSENDFHDLVRSEGGDVVERMCLVDEYRVTKPSAAISHCYRIVYRHMNQTLTQAEANEIHELIKRAAVNKLGVVLR